MALVMVFVLPIIFFSVFALIFSSLENTELRSIDVLLVDRDQSTASQRLIEAIRVDPQFELIIQTDASKDSKITSKHGVRGSSNKFPISLEIPLDLQASLGNGSQEVGLKIVYDPTEPMMRWVVASGVEDAVRRAFPEAIALKQLEKNLERSFPMDFEDSQKEAIRDALANLPKFSNRPPMTPPAAPELWRIDFVPNDAITNNPSAYYAAGTAVMFLLFSMAGAGGTLLEESHNGTLERLFNTGVTVQRLLLTKWLFFSSVAFVQLNSMFLWANLFFGVHLGPLSRIFGLVVITVFTSAGASAFGILLGSICRSRAQLNGISTVTILVMSAFGGSMAPRYAMSDFFDTVGLFTFNGWAIDGYLKVLWSTDPTLGTFTMISSIWRQVVVLAMINILCLFFAFRFGRRWESV
jgi:ABC-2 type transport system permease protein